MSEATRAYIYRIVLAVLTIAVAYGFISADELPVWIEVASAVLAIGTNALATLNTSTQR